MQERPAAEEHLRVIRSLMERATIYRAISAQAALAGGVLSCLAAAVSTLHQYPVRPVEVPEEYDPNPTFLWRWGAVLVLATALNFYFLRRDASRRGAPFFSAGMRMALFAMMPPLAVGLCLTFPLHEAFLGLGLELVTVDFWLLVYGLALLSTAHFAPRSLVRLGVLFLITGLVVAWLSKLDFAFRPDFPDILMALTFGGYHLAYAACTWPRKSPAVDAAATA